MRKVTWLDACEMKINYDEERLIDSLTSGKELLVVKETFGEVTELKDVVIITTEKDSDGERTVTVVPRGWVLE